MNDHASTRLVVLAALDDGPLAQRTGLAAAHHAGVARGELHFIHVLGWIPTHAGPAERAAGLDASSMLEAARVALVDVARASKFERDVVCHVAIGNPAQEILQMAARIEADVIFIGSHGRRGIERLLLGSVAERVVRSASCPVVVIRDKDYRDALAPGIEPPCPDCLAAQRATAGKTPWCARHAEKHPVAHVHYEQPETFAVGSMLVRP